MVAIKKALAAFKPRELRADETRNLADVEVKLRKVARTHVKGSVRMVDVAKAVKDKFGIDLPEAKLEALQQPMDESKAMYDDVVRLLEADPSFAALVTDPAVAEILPKPKPAQRSSAFDEVYMQAEQAQTILSALVATEWELDMEVLDHGKPFLSHPKAGTQKAWVDKVDNPGVKGRERAEEKVIKDYKGDASQLKDLARLTLVFDSCDRMVQAIGALRAAGCTTVLFKNKCVPLRRPQPQCPSPHRCAHGGSPRRARHQPSPPPAPLVGTSIRRRWGTATSTSASR